MFPLLLCMNKNSYFPETSFAFPVVSISLDLNRYYRGAISAILVYDITSNVTFEKVKDWVKELQTNVQEDISKEYQDEENNII